MVNSCCVPECKSGYKSVKKSDTVSLFRFPKNEIIRQKWIKAIPRKNWSVTQNHRVCAHHFDKSILLQSPLIYFISESTDKREARKQACTNSRLQRCRLNQLQFLIFFHHSHTIFLPIHLHPVQQHQVHQMLD